MNNTVTRLSDLAWSKLESLSRTRKFIQRELDHSHSMPQAYSPERFRQALSQIDHFTAEFSSFLQTKRSQKHQPDVVEAHFDEFSARYSKLMESLENMPQH